MACIGNSSRAGLECSPGGPKLSESKLGIGRGGDGDRAVLPTTDWIGRVVFIAESRLDLRDDVEYLEVADRTECREFDR